MTADVSIARPPGVNVAGFLRGGLGLGEAARLYVAALRAAGAAVRTTTVDVHLAQVHGATVKTTDFDDLDHAEELDFNLVAVNAPELPRLHDELGEAFFADRYTIGVWAWETDVIPSTWDQAFALVDEIWVYSRYVADLLSPVAPCPVVRVPLPIVAPSAQGEPLPFTLPDAFTFLFSFDFYSTLQRKNPLGLLDAFTRAFAPGEGPHLVLKSFNGDFKPDRLEQLRRAAGDRPDVHIVDRFVPEPGRAALMAACDCYVSLHRSEGFGLTIGEAMALGKPVVATGYGGNLDFMTPENSYLVRHGMTQVGPEGENYPANGRWAEPDLDHAAEVMRRVWERREEAAALAERGRRDVAEQFSLEAVGQVALERLKRLQGLRRRRAMMGATSGAGGPSGSLPAANGWLGRVAAQASFDPAAYAAASGGMKGLARRSALKAMRPYTYHQDELNRAVAAALAEIDQRGAELQVDWQATARRLERRIAALSDTLSEDDQRLLREGMRARPAPRHPAIAHRDEHGRWVLGFTGAASSGEGYRGFEDIFRGTEGEIRQRQEVYLPLLEGAEWVLDLGCGRGELLDLLRDRGIAARGIDLDETMVERCRAKGHDVELADAITYLREQPDRSVPAAFAAQVIEHLPSDVLQELLALLVGKLAPGGVAVLETVNPHSPPALKAFWTDTTHHHPLFPEVTLALCRLAGFDAGEVLFPGGSGDFERDVYDSRDYAVVARTAPAP